MATNFFWIGYHFEKSRSQVAIRKKDLFHTLKMEFSSQYQYNIKQTQDKNKQNYKSGDC